MIIWPSAMAIIGTHDSTRTRVCECVDIDAAVIALPSLGLIDRGTKLRAATSVTLIPRVAKQKRSIPSR